MTKTRIGLTAALIFAVLLAWLGFTATGYPSALDSKRYDRTPVRIDNVRLISMSANRPQIELNQSVLIVNGVIEAVGQTGNLQTPPTMDIANLTIIDGKG